MSNRFQKQRKQHGKDKRAITKQFHGHRKGMLLKRSPASFYAMKLLQEVAWALAYAHQRGVVHRDIKTKDRLRENAY